MIDALLKRLKSSHLAQCIHAQQTCHIRAINEEDSGSIAALFDVDALVKSNLLDTSYVRADYQYGRRMQPDKLLTQSEIFSALKAKLESGWTIVSDGVERSSSDILSLCHQVSMTHGYICRANLFVSPPGAVGFPAHFDAQDALIIHIIGTKEWHVGKQRMLLPRRNELSPPNLKIDRRNAVTYELEPGDLLYIPKGYPHVVENNGSAYGAQITLACNLPTVEDVLLECLAAALNGLPEINKDLPLDPTTQELEDIAAAAAKIANAFLTIVPSEIAARVIANHVRQMDYHGSQNLLVPSKVLATSV